MSLHNSKVPFENNGVGLVEFYVLRGKKKYGGLSVSHRQDRSIMKEREPIMR
jgi:hypothetical protein